MNYTDIARQSKSTAQGIKENLLSMGWQNFNGSLSGLPNFDSTVMSDGTDIVRLIYRQLEGRVTAIDYFTSNQNAEKIARDILAAGFTKKEILNDVMPYQADYISDNHKVIIECPFEAKEIGKVMVRFSILGNKN